LAKRAASGLTSAARLAGGSDCACDWRAPARSA
jgi:hypothetical protein